MVIKIKPTKKMLVVFGVIFFVGFAGGLLAEHVIHYFQCCKSAHALAGEHGGHSH